LPRVSVIIIFLSARLMRVDNTAVKPSARSRWFLQSYPIPRTGLPWVVIRLSRTAHPTVDRLELLGTLDRDVHPNGFRTARRSLSPHDSYSTGNGLLVLRIVAWRWPLRRGLSL
jgi:hypothetical protein